MPTDMPPPSEATLRRWREEKGDPPGVFNDDLPTEDAIYSHATGDLKALAGRADFMCSVIVGSRSDSATRNHAVREWHETVNRVAAWVARHGGGPARGQ